MPGDTKPHILATPKPANPSPTTEALPAAVVAATAPKFSGRTVVAQFTSPEGSVAGPPMNLPAEATPEMLEMLVNEVLKNEEPLPYSFYVDDIEIRSDVLHDVVEEGKRSTEQTIRIVYQPQAIFKVRQITRCTSTMQGHDHPIVCLHFSPSGSLLATGSGDTTVRIWDMGTETPSHTLRGHTHHVECVQWSPDARLVASGSMDNTVRVWDASSGKGGEPMKGHKGCITALAWEPFHSDPSCTRLASASKDGTVRVWDVVHRRTLFAMGGHTAPVMAVRWGGDGLIYTGSRDKTVKVWSAKDGRLVRTLQGHAHWVNALALSTEHVLRTGGFDEKRQKLGDRSEAHAHAVTRYSTLIARQSERLLSCSDDFTLFLWDPSSPKPIARLTGHQQPVTGISFSPDGTLIASASFDGSVKLWHGATGKFLRSMRGHVGAVFCVTFSPDGRMVASGSRDSTVKVWDVATGKMKAELPGHADEVYGVDWAPGKGERVASGGKDGAVKIWRN